jgi:hypothetical protein
LATKLFELLEELLLGFFLVGHRVSQPGIVCSI